MVRAGRRRFQGFLIFVGLLLLIIGAAGPRWGTAAPTALLSGKDIVVVLDASRSMMAEQPSRLELVVNLATAKTLGLSIPPGVILQADQVID